MIYNIYKFQENQRTKNRSLFTHSLTLTMKIMLKNYLRKIQHFCIQNSKIHIPIWILIFVGAILQLVQNLKPIRQLLCTFSSCSVRGMYMIYNIYTYIVYKFQERNKGPKTITLHSLTFHFSQRKQQVKESWAQYMQD